MHIKTLTIKNFRALEEIEVEFAEGVNVIVGPNAIGKTLILEAIRLVKALLAPRTPNEPNQVLVSLGAIAPHDPNTLMFDIIARDQEKPVEISSTYELSAAEFAEVGLKIKPIAENLVKAGLGQAFSNPAMLITYLSSPQGKEAQTRAETEIKQAYEQVRAGGSRGRLSVVINPDGRFENPDRLFPMFVSYLERELSPHLTRFSYFPADRALPSGEVPLQIGSADAAAQLESHNSQPQTKYIRLKNTIFSAVVAGSEEREKMEVEFQKIFKGILKGKILRGIGANRYGLLQVLVQDTETAKDFTIDAMSSGEKGLVLTFLLIARTLVQDGLILVDEPELHLNPAVCKSLVAFLVDGYVQPKNLQAILCSHSPEILASVFDKEGCTLFHLVEPNLITRVRQSDRDVIAEALRALGTTVSDELLYKATIFVEGPEDVEILEAGFSELLRRYRLKDLGGRSEVEKHIQQLQDAERKGTPFSRKYFIFDLDQDRTLLRDSPQVKVLQWNRRSLENYLLDADSLTDLLTDPEIISEPLANEGEVSRTLKQLAMAQLDDLVVKETYDEYRLENPGLRAREIEGLDFRGAGELLFDRIENIKTQMSNFEREPWTNQFFSACEERKRSLTSSWEANWRDTCDAKKLFDDLYRRRNFRVSPLKLKKKVVLIMKTRNTPAWQSLERVLSEFLRI